MRVFTQKLLKYLQQVVDDVVVKQAKVEAAAAAVPRGTDPLFGEESDARYRELRRQIALES